MKYILIAVIVFSCRKQIANHDQPTIALTGYTLSDYILTDCKFIFDTCVFDSKDSMRPFANYLKK